MEKTAVRTYTGFSTENFQVAMGFLTPIAGEESTTYSFIIMAAGTRQRTDGNGQTSSRLVVRYVRVDDKGNPVSENGWADAYAPVGATAQAFGLTREDILAQVELAIDAKRVFTGDLVYTDGLDRRGNPIMRKINGFEIALTRWENVE